MDKEEVLNQALSFKFGGMSKNELSFIYDFCKDKTVLELGSMVGMSSYVIASVCNSVCCVDKWTDTFDILSLRQAEIYKNDWLKDKPKYLTMLDVFKNNCRIFLDSGKMKMFQGETGKICDSFKDEKFDIILIDADHEYEGVKNDIKKYIGKAKKTGNLMFHDYGCAYWTGVEQACIEYIVENKIEIIKKEERIAIFKIID